jgi:aminopeptidase-like protein
VNELQSLASAQGSEAAAAEALQLMRVLQPICRSITGNGVRQTLEHVASFVDLQTFEVPSGTRVFDWEVPKEWNIREAWLKDPRGRTIASLAESTLRVVSYSTPIRARMSLAELRPHLHSLPDHPDWIPYRTSYYREAWGFCLRHRELEALSDGEYEVCIDSTLDEKGSLTYAECLLPGTSAQEFLLYTHVCHPATCNDNLTGIAALAILGRALAKMPRRYTYRLVFAPGTIGAITWLARNEALTKRIRHGLVTGLLGVDGPLVYKRSREGSYDIDRIAQAVLPGLENDADLRDFSPYGYDERQFCSPGFNLPVGRLTRTPNGEYPQYHTSADDLTLIDPARLAASLRALARMIAAAESNRRYRNLSPKCEPRLGVRGLYRPTGGANVPRFEESLLWVLNQSDGGRDLLEIAQRSRLSMDELALACEALMKAGLLEPAQGSDVTDGSVTDGERS